MGCLCSTNNVANDTLDPEGACSEVQQQSTAPGSLFPDLQVPIYFIKLESLLSRDTFPRYPENKDLSVSLDDIDITNSFLVFVSHCWARGWAGAKGWDGRPHPDDMHHSKIALCKKGIKKLWQELAPQCGNCYIWLDFGCINQDKSPCAELKQLDKIIQVCDCVFTPIVEDEDDIKRHLDKKNANSHMEADQVATPSEDQQDDIAKHYNSKKWNGDEHAYLNRGWTRVEMFYASAIPILSPDNNSALENGLDIGNKISQFKAGLHTALSTGRRPQFVYGTYQMKHHLPMRVLPPLLHSYFHRYNPMNGNLSVASDRTKISALVDELMPYLKFAVESYDGDYNDSSKKEGYGKCTYKNGDIYEGEFLDDKRSGIGTYYYADGCSYKGDWKEDKENGVGVFTYACGDVYKGEMMNGHFHGYGEIISVRGRSLKGTFDHDKFVKYEVSNDEVFPRFERVLSTSAFISNEIMSKIDFDCDLSCSSGGSDIDFDENLSCASFD